MKEIDFINIKLEELKNQEYKEFSKKSCPDTNREILGVKIPKLRLLAKDILKEIDWKEYLNIEPEKYFEEVMLKGFIIAYSKISTEEKIKLIEKFVPKIDSWAICDCFVNTLKIKKDKLEEYWNFSLSYINSAKEFEVRFSVIMMLNYYINDEYVDKVIQILDNIKHSGYYVKMGVAWAFAEIGIKYNSKIMKYLKRNNNLDDFTYNKTLQKMIESYRIDDKQKIILKGMKRKNKNF